MTLIPASRPNAYSGSPLDRAAHLRDDPAWIAERLADPASLFVPNWRARSLLRGDAEPQAVFLTGAECSPAGRAWAFLGLWNDRAVFAIDLSDEENPTTAAPDRFEDLRTVAGRLPPHDAAILAHARGVLHWRARHRFCSVCGGPCQPQSAGHVLVCTNCTTQHFPRSDPAVIMLVVKDDRCLLGHSQRFPSATMYSTLAGFVEPGETLEEAVAREVREETGVVVGRVHYHSSQPWPFPSSIMLGFYAEALTETLTVDTNELRDARWFSRAAVRGHEAGGWSLPRPDSIARRLIEDWVAAG